MKNRISMLHRQSALVGVLALGVSVMAPATSHATDWLDSIQDARCDPADINGVSQNVRNTIEASVRRAEMSIQAPTPVGDLACLNDLMTAPLDIFSNVGGLLSSLQSGLGNIAASMLNIDLDVSGMICGFAASKFAELTTPLSEMDKTMSGYASLSASASDRLSGATSAAFSDLASGTWDGSNTGSTNLSDYGGYTGVAMAADSAGYSGSIESYVEPDTTASTSDVVEVTYWEPTGSTPEDTEAWNEYNQRLIQSLGQYIGCRVAGELDGTQVSSSFSGSGTWNVPGTLSDCTFNPGPWPVTASSSASAVPAAASSQEASISPVNTEAENFNRQGGQERTVTEPKAGSAPRSDAQTIWDMLDQ